MNERSTYREIELMLHNVNPIIMVLHVFAIIQRRMIGIIVRTFLSFLLPTRIANPPRILVTVAKMGQPQWEVLLHFLIAWRTVALEVVALIRGVTVWKFASIVAFIIFVSDSWYVPTLLADVYSALDTGQGVECVTLNIKESDFYFFFLCRSSCPWIYVILESFS